jgi:DNA invertase Pin-like site-specific DNA recombinase
LDDATFVPVLKEALKRIRTRTAEGRSRAKARGKHMGRPPSLTPAQQN